MNHQTTTTEEEPMIQEATVNEFTMHCACPDCFSLWQIEAPSRAIAQAHQHELLVIPCWPCRRRAIPALREA